MYLPPPDRGRVDRVTCQHCGHLVWNHRAGDVCSECDRGHASSACGRFSLYGFVEPDATAIAAHTFQP